VSDTSNPPKKPSAPTAGNERDDLRQKLLEMIRRNEARRRELKEG